MEENFVLKSLWEFISRVGLIGNRIRTSLVLRSSNEAYYTFGVREVIRSGSNAIDATISVHTYVNVTL